MALELAMFSRHAALDIVAVAVLVGAVHFRRYRRADLVVEYVALNLSILVVSASLGATDGLSLGLGFGLFAVLSIVRLRSDETSPVDIGYTMAILVVGLVSGLPELEFRAKVALLSLLVVAIALTDAGWLRGAERCRIVIDRAVSSRAEIEAELRERFDGPVRGWRIVSIDTVRETTSLDVSWSPE